MKELVRVRGFLVQRVGSSGVGNCYWKVLVPCRNQKWDRNGGKSEQVNLLVKPRSSSFGHCCANDSCTELCDVIILRDGRPVTSCCSRGPYYERKGHVQQEPWRLVGLIPRLETSSF